MFKLIILLILLPVCSSANLAIPKRVAVIYSSGVDFDFRSKDEYDYALQSLKWQFDKYRNLQLNELTSKLDKYDIVLTCSLYNYGEPQDLSNYAQQFKDFIASGGALVLTDIAYAQHSDWLTKLDSNLFIAYENCQQQALLEPSELTDALMNFPNRIRGLGFWAHITSYGGAYKVVSTCKDGRPVILIAKIGKGVLIVTTAFNLPAAMLENIYENTIAIRCGLSLQFLPPMYPPMPPDYGELLFKVSNLREDTRKLQLVATLDLPSGQQHAKELLVRLDKLQTQPLRLNFRWVERGSYKLRLEIREAGAKLSESKYNFVIPPALEVSTNGRHFLANEELRLSVKLNIAQKELPKFALKASITSKQQQAVSQYIAELSSLTTDYYNFKFPISRLAAAPSGNYQLTVSLITKETDQIYEHLQIPVKVHRVKEVPNKVSIGERLAILLQNKPFLPIGTYHVGTADLAKVSKQGFNCVTSPILSGNEDEVPQYFKEFLDEAYKHKLMVIIELVEYLRHGRNNYQGIKNIVSELRLHPAVLAYYLTDEPAGWGISPEVVYEGFLAIKEIDRWHPVFVNEVVISAFKKYIHCCDIFGHDPYFITTGELKSAIHMANTTDLAYQASRYTKPVWMVLQAHRLPPPGSKHRYPTPSELRCMAYLALNHNAKGLLFYAYGDIYGDWYSGFAYDATLWNYFKILNKELKDIAPLYLKDEGSGKLTIEIEPKEAPIDLRLLQVSGKVHLIAINYENRKLAIKFKIDGGNFSSAFKKGPAQLGRSIKLLEGCWQDKFTPFAVHIYELR